MKLTALRALELATFVGLYVGTAIFIAEPNSRPTKPETVRITDIQATIAEVPDNAPTIIEELPDEPAVAVSGGRDSEPPAVPPVVSAKAAPSPRQIPARHDPQPVPQRAQQRQCQPICQPEPACRRRGLGGLFQWLGPFSDD